MESKEQFQVLVKGTHLGRNIQTHTEVEHQVGQDRFLHFEDDIDPSERPMFPWEAKSAQKGKTEVTTEQSKAKQDVLSSESGRRSMPARSEGAASCPW